MPIIKSAVKRAKQTVKRRDQHIATKRALKDATKAFVAKPSADTLSAAQSAVDTAVKKNVLNKNTAARRMANLAKTAKEAGIKMAAPAKKAPAKATPAKTAPAKAPAKKAPAAKAPAKEPVAKKPATKTATKK